MRKILTLTMSGLVTVLPLALTVYVIWWLVHTVEGWLRRALIALDIVSPEHYWPGLGLIAGFLLLLFVGSGCAALIYEIVWFQLLQLVIGSSAVSLGALLGTFMGGMCLGSVSLARWISARRHPLRVYALLEIGIGSAGGP